MERKALRAWVSGPAHNEAQKTGFETIQQAATDAGMVVLSPDPAGIGAAFAVDSIRSSDLAIFWMDGLMPPGVTIHALGGIQKNVIFPFPPPFQQIVDAGFQTTGRGTATLNKQKPILLPGEVDACSNSPKGLPVQLPGNVVICELCSPSLNIPDGNVVFEAGIAFALGIPFVMVLSAPAISGSYLVPREVPMAFLAGLSETLIKVAAAETVKQGLDDLRQTTLKVLEGLEEQENGGETTD